jgi:endonuclease/exonuclease/phosphatase family metal-dependent hydrolase
MRPSKAALAGVVAALVAGLAAMVPGGAATAGAVGPEIRVGTFNIATVSNDPTASGEHRVWKVRRAAVVSQITGQHLDVLGLQEADQSTVYAKRLVDGRTQYLDVRNGLNAAGGNYKLTSIYPYNCVRGWTKYKCHYRYRGASGDNRILYNASTLSLVGSGMYRYPHQTRGKNPRFLVWARLRVLATGQDFLFTTTHLDPYTKSVRIAEWHDLIAKVNTIKGDLPVVITGDFNSSKFSDWASSLLPAMVANGYGDALGQRYAANGGTPRATGLVHVWVNSFNAWRRNVADYGYDQDRFNTHNPRTGNGIDWIFVSNNLAVPGFEVVNDMDESSLQLRGVIPSDHNMLRATITLP